MSKFFGLKRKAEKLFVLIGTYNHESFISQAIEGALAQRVDMPFRILVRDDASTDRTAEIVASYAKSNRGKLLPILYKENQHLLGRGWAGDLFQRVSRLARFTDREKVYVALCEGDDFWTDTTKLQRQVDFLRANPTAALVHHGFQVITEEGGNKEYEGALRNHLSHFEPHPPLRKGSDLLDGNFIMTCAVMMRLSGWSRRERRGRPAGVLGDWVNAVVASRGRMVGFINREMSTYRVHRGGEHSTLSYERQKLATERTVSYLGTLRWRGSIS